MKVTKPKKSPKKSKIPQRLRGITASNLSMHTYNLPTSCIVIVLSLRSRCQVGRYRRRNADSVSRVPRTCPMTVTSASHLFNLVLYLSPHLNHLWARMSRLQLRACCAQRHFLCLSWNSVATKCRYRGLFQSIPARLEVQSIVGQTPPTYQPPASSYPSLSSFKMKSSVTTIPTIWIAISHLLPCPNQIHRMPQLQLKEPYMLYPSCPQLILFASKFRHHWSVPVQVTRITTHYYCRDPRHSRIGTWRHHKRTCLSEFIIDVV